MMRTKRKYSIFKNVMFCFLAALMVFGLFSYNSACAQIISTPWSNTGNTKKPAGSTTTTTTPWGATTTTTTSTTTTESEITAKRWGTLPAGWKPLAGCGKQTCPGQECYVKYSLSMHKCGPSINAKCATEEMAKTGGLCLNTLPVSCTVNVSPECWRDKGTKGRPQPRYHMGVDIGSTGCANQKRIEVQAAADGTIVKATTTGHSGRTIVIDHEKTCEPLPKQSGEFHTVYRHLFAYIKESGPVKKGDPIGIEGGSNSKSGEGHKPCDNTLQSQMQGYDRSGCPEVSPKGYPIHLHLEIQDGPLGNGGTAASKTGTINGYCDKAQTLCGGCNNNVSKCDNGTKAQAGNESDEASLSDIENTDIYANESPCEFTGAYFDEQSCVFCEFFKVIFNAASSVAKTANDNFASASADLVSIGFMVWLAIYILRNIASFGATDPGQLLKGILFQGARVAAVVLILKTALYPTLDLTLTPVLQTGLSFAQTLNGDSKCDVNASYMKDIKGYDSATGIQANSNGGLSQQLGGSFICSIKNLEDAVSTVMALGEYSLCLGMNDYAILKWIIPHVGFILTGLCLWILGLIILLAFPWFLIDCVLQLCIASALIPCAIAAFAFKITSKYLNIVWNFFMNAMFTFVFMSIIIFILIPMLKQLIGIDPGGEGINSGLENSNFSLAGIVSGVASDPRYFVNAIGGISWWSTFAFRLIGICMICWAFSDEAISMARKFADSPVLGGGKTVGPMVGGAAAHATKTSAKVAYKTAKLGVALGKAAVDVSGNIMPEMSSAKQEVADFANAHMGNKIRSLTNQAKGKMFTMFGGRTVSSEGQPTAYAIKTRFFGQEVNRTFEKDADGLWTETKETHRFANYDKHFAPATDYIGNVMHDKDGHVIYNKIKRDWRGRPVVVEQMTKQYDPENAKLIYTTADGKNVLTTDESGNVISYKTPGESKEQAAVTHESHQRTNDSFLISDEIRDANGNLIGVDIEPQNVASRYLIDADGTMNDVAVSQIMNSSANKELAARYILEQTMEQRGDKLEKRFAKTNMQINKDGSLSLQQKELDGSTTQIHAAFVGKQLLITKMSKDEKGNILLTKSNGILTKTDRLEAKSDSTYLHKTNFSFSSKTYQKTDNMPPLDQQGNWHINVDSKATMTGFDKDDYTKLVKHFNKKMTTDQISKEQADALINVYLKQSQ